MRVANQGLDVHTFNVVARFNGRQIAPDPDRLSSDPSRTDRHRGEGRRGTDDYHRQSGRRRSSVEGGAIADIVFVLLGTVAARFGWWYVERPGPRMTPNLVTQTRGAVETAESAATTTGGADNQK